MPDLFGIDIAGLVASSIQSAGGVRGGTFVSVTVGDYSVDDPSGPPDITTATVAFKGFVEQVQKRFPGQADYRLVSKITILGGSIAGGVIPKIDEVATIDGVGYRLTELTKSDPAGAVYEFLAEKHQSA